MHGVNLGSIEPTNWAIEVDSDDDLGDGTVRTPMLEFGIDDYNHILRTGEPMLGAYALGDNGDMYQYQNDYDGALNGPFRRFFKKVKKKVRKGVKRIKKVIKKGKVFKKILTKTKWGRALVKIGGKVFKPAMKIVKPFVKKFGPYLKKLAPVAMAIPGIGPAAAAILANSGKIRDAMKKGRAVLKKVHTVSKKTGKIYNTYRVKAKKPQKFVRSLRRSAEELKQVPLQQKKRMLDAATNALRTAPPSVARQMFNTQESSNASKAAARKLSMLAQRDNALAFAQDRSKPLYERRRAMKRVRDLNAKNQAMNLQTLTPVQKSQKISSLLTQLRVLGVNV